ncbi:MAG: fused MFS/spermidine synthase, partial [Bacteroidota bacterium]
MKGQSEKIAFFVAVIVAGLCSLIYELLISTTSSYFLGDSVKQFSLTIGVYMAAMGLGAYLTKFIQRDLLDWFVKVEIALGLVGGMSIPLLYLVFDQLSTWQYELVMLSITFLIGVLTGFEVPLLVRILKTYYPLKSNLAYVLSLDYLGALIATLLFPFLLLPFVGTFQTSILFGMINVALGFWIYRFFTRRLSVQKKNWLQVAALVCLLFFLVLLSFSGRLLAHWEDGFYSHRIIHSEQTPYQKLVLTQNKEDLKLFINRIIQFSSDDEYRYHEALAVLPLELARRRQSVLILGGGEGLLAREVLRYSEVAQVTIVDLDGAVFELARQHPRLRQLNADALYDPRVQLVSQDAMVFLKERDQVFDLILADLPD